MPATCSPYRRFSAEEPVSSSCTVVVHPDHDPEEFDRLLDEHHYLGSRCQAGDYLRQSIYFNGDLVENENGSRTKTRKRKTGQTTHFGKRVRPHILSF